MNIINFIGQISLKDFIKNFDKIVSPYQVWKFINPGLQKHGINHYIYIYIGENPKRVDSFMNSVIASNSENENPEKVLTYTKLNSQVSIPDSWLRSKNLVYLVKSDFRKESNTNSINLKFSNILEHLNYERWYNELKDYYYDNLHDGDLAYNIKIHRLNIPEEVEEKLSPQAIDNIIWSTAGWALEDFIDYLKSEFKDISSVFQAGRSGGWLHIQFSFDDTYKYYIWDAVTEDEDIEHALYNIIQEEDDDSDEEYVKEKLNVLTQIGFKSKEILDMLKNIEIRVKELVSGFIDDLESMEFWQQYIDT
jgi:hypothetical protein